MCYSPVTIKTPQGYKKVPCHHCLECLTKYQQDWSNRMYEELKAHDGKGVFFTLTYDELHVPKNYLRYGTDKETKEATYELFRSPSDYGYSNTYTDEKGRERVLPSCGRERKAHPVAPYVELQRAAMDMDNGQGREFDPDAILDFNIKRQNHKQFIEQIYKIYGNFVRTYNDSLDSPQHPRQDTPRSDDSGYDFDTFEGDDFNFDQDLDQSTFLLNEAMADVIEDDTYESGDENPILRSRADLRPVMSFNSVRKKDVQNWLKRGRDKLSRDGKEFTYFITSEYGPRTLRPHYHGVLFGVTAEESLCMMKDWQRHFGIQVKWDNVDLSKGDGSYCAKYCSKGFFEHPLCSKHFFYSRALKTADGVEVLPFTEYHSKHYERCIELFGIDEPIVDPTFHLISKGFGSRWLDDNKDLVSDFDNWFDFDFGDASATTVSRCIAPWDDDYSTFLDKGYKPDEAGFITYDYDVKRLNNKNLKSKNYEETINKLFRRFHYYRTYKDKTYPYGVPKYYRTKIFNDGLRCAFANYVQQRNVEVYQQKLAALCSDFSLGETNSMVSQMEAQERDDHYARAKRIYKKLNKQYNKSQI